MATLSEGVEGRKRALRAMEDSSMQALANKTNSTMSGSGATTAVPAEKVLQTHTHNGKRPTVVIYPNVSPETIVVPIVSCIFGFPVLALLVICCLRRRAKLARERARRRNCELDRGELSLVRLSPLRSRGRAVSLARSPRALPSLELDTVLEERSDPEQTLVEMMTPDKEVNLIMSNLILSHGPRGMDS